MNRERRQIEGCNSSVSQEARPSCFVKQKLIGAREGSEAWEGPIDFTINTSTGGIRKEETQKKPFPEGCAENSVMRVTLPRGTPRAL